MTLYTRSEKVTNEEIQQIWLKNSTADRMQYTENIISNTLETKYNKHTSNDLKHKTSCI